MPEILTETEFTPAIASEPSVRSTEVVVKAGSPRSGSSGARAVDDGEPGARINDVMAADVLRGES